MKKFILQNVKYTLHVVRPLPRQHVHTSTTMENTRMKTPKLIVGALVVYCIVVLLIGMANAADLTRPATADHFKSRAGQFAPQKIIGRLEQQGVDVTEVKAALQNHDTASVKTWLDAYLKAHPDAKVAGHPFGHPAGKDSRQS
jgi:hypothetical protein